MQSILSLVNAPNVLAVSSGSDCNLNPSRCTDEGIEGDSSGVTKVTPLAGAHKDGDLAV